MKIKLNNRIFTKQIILGNILTLIIIIIDGYLEYSKNGGQWIIMTIPSILLGTGLGIWLYIEKTSEKLRYYKKTSGAKYRGYLGLMTLVIVGIEGIILAILTSFPINLIDKTNIIIK